MVVEILSCASPATPATPDSSTRCDTHRSRGQIAELAQATRARASRFANIVETIQTALYRYVRRLTSSAEDARDIVQDVYLTAWRAAQDGQAPFVGECDAVAVRRWLFCVASHRAASLARHHRVIPFHSLDAITEADIPASATPAHLAPSFDELIVESHLMRAALAQLPPEDVACLLLSVVQGYTASEMAQTLGITAEAARKRLSRAMQRLRVAYLAQEFEPPSGAAGTTRTRVTSTPSPTGPSSSEH